MQYLFVWSLVTRRFEIAQFLLVVLTDITAGALFAATFLRLMSKLARSPSDSEDFKVQARFAHFVKSLQKMKCEFS